MMNYWVVENEMKYNNYCAECVKNSAIQESTCVIDADKVLANDKLI